MIAELRGLLLSSLQTQSLGVRGAGAVSTLKEPAGGRGRERGEGKSLQCERTVWMAPGLCRTLA